MYKSHEANMPSSNPVDLTVAFDGLGRLTLQTGTLGAEPVSRSFTYDGLSRLKTASGPWEKPLGVTSSVTWTYSYDALGNLRTQASSRGALGDARTWDYLDASRPHFLSAFNQQNQPGQTIAPTAFGEPGTITVSGQDPQQLLWNAQGKLYRSKDSTYSYDAFDQSTLVVTGSGSNQTSIIRVGDDFEYDLSAGRATKYFSVDGVRIAVLATTYTASSASVPPAVSRVARRLEPLGPPLAAGFLLLGLVSLASIATRRRSPVWLSAPGVSVLSLVLVAMPYPAYAATPGSGGPGKFGRPAEPFLAYIPDHLGSVRAVVNQNGVVVETRDYDPFGADIAHVGAFSTQHRFTGQPADDPAGGLYNYGARFYNPKWGRFISPDEVTQGFDSQGLNPFAYVLNRPTSATDPNGRSLVAAAALAARVGQLALGGTAMMAYLSGANLNSSGWRTGLGLSMMAVAALGVAGIVVAAPPVTAFAAATLTVTAVSLAVQFAYGVAMAADGILRLRTVEVGVDGLEPAPYAPDTSVPEEMRVAASAAMAGEHVPVKSVEQSSTGQTTVLHTDGTSESVKSGTPQSGQACATCVTVTLGGLKLDVDRAKSAESQKKNLESEAYDSGFGGNVAQSVSLALWAANVGW